MIKPREITSQVWSDYNNTGKEEKELWWWRSFARLFAIPLADPAQFKQIASSWLGIKRPPRFMILKGELRKWITKDFIRDVLCCILPESTLDEYLRWSGQEHGQMTDYWKGFDNQWTIPLYIFYLIKLHSNNTFYSVTHHLPTQRAALGRPANNEQVIPTIDENQKYCK